MPTIPAPHRTLNRQRADELATHSQVNALRQTCADHPTAECPSCSHAPTALDLRTRQSGYYPGEPHGITDPDRPPPNTGPRYSFLCPCCLSDLTHLVMLHRDLAHPNQ